MVLVQQTCRLLSLGSLLALVSHLPQVASRVSCQVLEDGVTDCSKKGLTYVPSNLPSNTKLLRLDGNQLERIEDFPFVMTDLEELILSENQIRQINTATFCHKLPNLRILRLTRNRLSTLPDLRVCKKLVELHSANNVIVQINGAMISGLARLEKLDLSKNNITNISASTFPTNTSIKQLLLNNNEISAMASGTFAGMPTLERLRMSRNKLVAIPKGLFSGLQNLQLLDLSKNRLTVIGHLYFTDLPKVKTINLERNRLTRLLDGSFYDCSALVSLNLQSNLLRSVRAGPFFGLLNLKELLLAKNNISELDENTWTQASSIAVLNLAQNNLRTIHSSDFTRATSIKSLNLAANKITRIEENAFNGLSNLNALDLSRNELSDSIQSSSTAVFGALTSLQSLDLRSNRLQTITSKLLRGLESLKALELGNNPVSTLQEYAFSTLPSLSNLGMSTDKLVCDCKISWLPLWLVQKQLSSTVRARCSFPPSSAGRSIFDLANPKDFLCDPGEVPARPLITRAMQPSHALRGANVTLTCIATASSQSPVTVEWTKDDKIIPTSSGLIHTDTSTADNRVALLTTSLTLTNVDMQAEANYQCGFKNEFGQHYSERTLLKILVFPSFTNTPNNVTVNTGRDVKLLCEATGYPQPFLSWSKDGGQNFPAARGRRFELNPDNLNEFIIRNAQWQDRGVYYCNATNLAGSLISNATVNVMVPPMFTEPISCTNTRVGAYLLKCQVDGNPKTPVVWYKDGHVIQASEKYVFSVTYNNLFIIDGTAEDSGMYMCSAKNLLGQVTQQCEIKIQDSTTTVVPATVAAVKKATALDQNTITGLIVIAVVCCVVGTSLVWVVIIYQTRRRQNRNGSDETEETTVPLNGDIKKGGDSVHKIGDSVSNSSGSTQTKTDSFFEYRSSQDSPSAFCKVRGKFPTMDSELAAAMEPLNPNQESIDSLTPEPHAPYQYSHHTVGAAGYKRGHSNNVMSASPAEYYTSERPHPFSTFQPSRHHRTNPHNSSHHKQNKPSHSVSAEFIPYIDRRLPPPDLAQVLHQLRAPTQPPQAVVTPAQSHRGPAANPVNVYEEPGYMNLPRSAVTPSLPNTSSSSAQEFSDYMNVEPRDIHIYQNASILSMKPRADTNTSTDASRVESEEGLTSNPSTLNRTELSNATSPPASTTSSQRATQSHNQNQSNNSRTPNDTHNSSAASNLTNASASSHSRSGNNTSSASSAKSKFLSRQDVQLHSPGRRREGLADSSFVERKYGLIFTGADGRHGCDDADEELARSNRQTQSSC